MKNQSAKLMLTSIVLVLVFLLSACSVKSSDNSTSNQSANDITSMENSSLAQGVLSDYSGKPKVKGTFVQPWFVKNWDKSDWETHYDTLIQADIDTMILQWTGDTQDDKFKYIGYPTKQYKNMVDNTTDIDEKYVENALAAAQNKKIKVFVGLNLSDQWWDNKFLDDAWCNEQANLAATMASELYSLYKSKYPDAFYGFYWSYEFYNNNSGYETAWAEMMNPVLDKITQLDTSMPILLSPFISGYISSSPVQLEKMWTNFFKKARFRDGDIFCSQDSYGASGLSLEYLEQQIIAMKKATLTKPGLKFWVNCENFVGADGDGPAPVSRFIKQLETFSKYADNIISYSYSEYYTTLNDDNQYHDEYLKYLKSN